MQKEFINRADQFRWDQEVVRTIVEKNQTFFAELGMLRDRIICECQERQSVDEEKIQNALSAVINFVVNWFVDRELSPWNRFSYHVIQDTLMFTTLCAYIDTSRRIPAVTLEELVEKYSPIASVSKEPEVERLRQARYRIFKRKRQYYNYKKYQQPAIPKDAEDEWAFFFEIYQSDETVQDTFKRFGNLYKDINSVLDSQMDEEFPKRIQGAYKRFESKLSKIQYENYLKLQKVLRDRVVEKDTYYGINLYRLERMMRPYLTTKEVQALLSNPVEEEFIILSRALWLTDIEFPPVYDLFATLPISAMESWSIEFERLRNFTETAGCLILDEMIEKGLLGENWEDRIRTTINEMAETVLYDPSKIDFTICEGAQEKFEELYKWPVRIVIARALELYEKDKANQQKEST